MSYKFIKILGQILGIFFRNWPRPRKGIVIFDRGRGQAEEWFRPRPRTKHQSSAKTEAEAEASVGHWVKQVSQKFQLLYNILNM